MLIATRLRPGREARGGDQTLSREIGAGAGAAVARHVLLRSPELVERLLQARLGRQRGSALSLRCRRRANGGRRGVGYDDVERARTPGDSPSDRMHELIPAQRLISDHEILGTSGPPLDWLAPTAPANPTRGAVSKEPPLIRSGSLCLPPPSPVYPVEARDYTRVLRADGTGSPWPGRFSWRFLKVSSGGRSIARRA